MDFSNLKLTRVSPAFILALEAISAIIFRFDLYGLHWLSLLLIAIVLVYGIRQPWLLLLASIPALFAIEPTPTTLGLKEINIIILLGAYSLSTYFHAFQQNKANLFNYLLKSHLIIFILIALSAHVALHNGVKITDWARGIAPFLLLYLALPISISLKEDFDNRMFWYFISFSILALMLILYINIVFFLEHFNSFYWVNKNNGTRIYSLPDMIDQSHWVGPYRDRITLRIQESTSVLLPVSFTLFSLIAIYMENKRWRGCAVVLSTLSLFTILETLTRSMLMSSVLVLFCAGLHLLMSNRKKFMDYVKVMTFVFALGFAFIFATQMETIWLGRVYSLINGFSGLLATKQAAIQKSNTNKQPQTLDQNVNARMNEYKIALEFFANTPVVGSGIGIKHEIQFPVDDHHFITEKVGYIHNWFFYWLMVGGVLGVIFYSAVLLGPIFYFLRMRSYSYILRNCLIYTLLIMSIYSCFFAVFRLLPFNLILALSLGIFLHSWKSGTRDQLELFSRA